MLFEKVKPREPPTFEFNGLIDKRKKLALIMEGYRFSSRTLLVNSYEKFPLILGLILG